MARAKKDKLDKQIQRSFGATRRELLILGKGNAQEGWRVLNRRFNEIKTELVRSKDSELDKE